MDKIKMIVIIIAGLVAAYFIIRMIIEPSYEVLERSSISLPDYNYEDPSQKGISEEWSSPKFCVKTEMVRLPVQRKFGSHVGLFGVCYTWFA